MTSPYLSTRIKLRMNSLLAPLGLQIGTTALMRAEELRLERLRAKGHWNTPHYDQGLKFEPEKFMNFLRETCLPYKSDYSMFARAENGNDQEFCLDNEYFRAVDAEVLYSVIRKYKPNHIVEVGSGFSTRLMARAIREGKLATTITSIDPAPRIAMAECVTEHVQSPVEHVARELLTESLAEGDLLFIDSSHSVISGGDVPFLFLEVLPRLRKRVWIHVHDIHLPFEYPAEYITAGWGWNEQYLVHAFLYHNDAFEILWPARYMFEHSKNAVLDVIPGGPDLFPPSSLWLRKAA